MNVFERIYDCNGEIGFKKKNIQKPGVNPQLKAITKVTLTASPISYTFTKKANDNLSSKSI